MTRRAAGQVRRSARTLRSRMQLVVGVLVALLLVSAAATGYARLVVAAAEHDLRTQVLPASQASTALLTAYVDQETGQRGFLLTADPQFLQPYTAGRAEASRLTARLEQLIHDAAGRRALAAVQAAADDWRTQAAEPEIAARREGPIPAPLLESLGLNGKSRFDTLRLRVADLQARTAALESSELGRISTAGVIADGVIAGTVVLAVLIGAWAFLVLRRDLTRPLDRLIGQVRAVAVGEHDAPITVSAPEELAAIADSVERMRASIVHHQRQLTLREEHDRLATELHDLTMQRLFGLGLALTAIGRRHETAAADLAPLIAETDSIIGEVRAVIFDLGRAEAPEGLRGRVADLVDDSSRALGFPPTVEFSGPVDATGPVPGDALLFALREALSNVARHAEATRALVRVAAEDGELSLTVLDDGVGIGATVGRDLAGRDIAGLHARAAPLGGSASVRPGSGGGTVVEWRVPVEDAVRDPAPVR